MTAMANQTPKALEDLKFYVVTKSWFVRAWPILTMKPNDDLDETIIGDDLTVHIGRIQNSELVLDPKSQGSTEEKEEADDEANPADGHGNPQEYDIDQSKQNISEYYRRISENPTMKKGLVHTKDYFFLGPSAWMLVKEKFGFDGYEISRCCKKVDGQGRIEIALLEGEKANESTTNNLESTVVPLSGRFQYEKVFSSNNKNNNNNNNNNAGAVNTNSMKSRRAAMLDEVSYLGQRVKKSGHCRSLYKAHIFQQSYIFSLSNNR